MNNEQLNKNNELLSMNKAMNAGPEVPNGETQNNFKNKKTHAGTHW